MMNRIQEVQDEECCSISSSSGTFPSLDRIHLQEEGIGAGAVAAVADEGLNDDHDHDANNTTKITERNRMMYNNMHHSTITSDDGYPTDEHTLPSLTTPPQKEKKELKRMNILQLARNRLAKKKAKDFGVGVGSNKDISNNITTSDSSGVEVYNDDGDDDDDSFLADDVVEVADIDNNKREDDSSFLINAIVDDFPSPNHNDFTNSYHTAAGEKEEHNGDIDMDSCYDVHASTLSRASASTKGASTIGDQILKDSALMVQMARNATANPANTTTTTTTTANKTAVLDNNNNNHHDSQSATSAYSYRRAYDNATLGSYYTSTCSALTDEYFYDANARKTGMSKAIIKGKRSTQGGGLTDNGDNGDINNIQRTTSSGPIDLDNGAIVTNDNTNHVESLALPPPHILSHQTSSYESSEHLTRIVSYGECEGYVDERAMMASSSSSRGKYDGSRNTKTFGYYCGWFTSSSRLVKFIVLFSILLMLVSVASVALALFLPKERTTFGGVVNGSPSRYSTAPGNNKDVTKGGGGSDKNEDVSRQNDVSVVTTTTTLGDSTDSPTPGPYGAFSFVTSSLPDDDDPLLCYEDAPCASEGLTCTDGTTESCCGKTYDSYVCECRSSTDANANDGVDGVVDGNHLKYRCDYTDACLDRSCDGETTLDLEDMFTTSAIINNAPTIAPIDDDSDAPTKEPTSNDPTSGPSEGPTQVPSREPSNQPTAIPSKTPTHQPTTLSPTPSPSKAPESTAPTNTPTTKQPSRAPTSVPSKRPTPLPTQKPSSQPTPIPSKTPTPRPTTSSPTPLPTMFPIATMVPSAAPVKMPTEKPTTLRPTPLPTEFPIISTTTPTTAPPTPPPSSPTVVSQPSPSQTVTLQVTRDTYTNETSSQKNYGGKKRLRVDGSPKVWSFLVFDTTSVIKNTPLMTRRQQSSQQPAPASQYQNEPRKLHSVQVLQAKIRLYSLGEGGDVIFYALPNAKEDQWTESGLTWKSMNNVDRSEQIKVGSISWVDPYKWYEIDVTDAFADDYMGSNKVAVGTFLIKSASTNGVAFASRERSSGFYSPKLVLTYTVDAGIHPTQPTYASSPTYWPTPFPTEKPSKRPTTRGPHKRPKRPTNRPTDAANSLPSIFVPPRCPTSADSDLAFKDTLLPGQSTPSVHIVFPSQDSYVAGGEYSDENYGSADVLVLDSTTSKALIEFDLGLIGLTSSFYNIASLSLRLFVNSVGDTSSPPQLDIYKLPNSFEWDEGQVTLDNFGIPPMAEAGPVTFQITSSDEGSWVDIDVKDFIGGGQANMIFLSMTLSPSGEAGKIVFASRETCHSPKLVVVTESI